MAEIQTIKTVQDYLNFVDDATYVNYAYNRARTPDIAPDGKGWGRIFPNVTALEKRYQAKCHEHDSQILDRISQVVSNYKGTTRVTRDSDNALAISYEWFGQPLSDIVEHIFTTEFPNRDHRITITPSDKTLIVTLL